MNASFIKSALAVRLSHISAVILLTYFSFTDAFAGAWVQPINQGYAAFNSFYYSTDEFYDEEGELQPQDRFSKLEQNFYAEWGVTDRSTLGANLFFNTVSQSDETSVGLSNAELFARHRVYQSDSSIISVQPLVKLASIYDQQSPRGGSSSYDGEIAVLYGRNIHLMSPRDYIDSTIALRARSDKLSPQFRSDTKLGLGITESLTVIPAIYTTRSLVSNSEEAFTQSGDTDFSLTKLELGMSYTLERYVINTSFFTHVEGTQTGAGHGFSLGMGMVF